MTTPKQSGGKRAGAGRPRAGARRRVSAQITFDPLLLAQVRAEAAQRGISRSAVVEAALIAYLPPAPLITIMEDHL